MQEMDSVKEPFYGELIFLFRTSFFLYFQKACVTCEVPQKWVEAGRSVEGKSTPIPCSPCIYILLRTAMATVTTWIFGQMWYKVFILYTRLARLGRSDKYA